MSRMHSRQAGMGPPVGTERDDSAMAAVVITLF